MFSPALWCYLSSPLVGIVVLPSARWIPCSLGMTSYQSVCSSVGSGILSFLVIEIVLVPKRSTTKGIPIWMPSWSGRFSTLYVSIISIRITRSLIFLRLLLRRMVDERARTEVGDFFVVGGSFDSWFVGGFEQRLFYIFSWSLLVFHVRIYNLEWSSSNVQYE